MKRGADHSGPGGPGRILGRKSGSPAALVALFVLLLCACAIPVLAFGAEPPEEVPAGQVHEPTGEELSAALGAREAEIAVEEREREEDWRRPPPKPNGHGHRPPTPKSLPPKPPNS